VRAAARPGRTEARSPATRAMARTATGSVHRTAYRTSLAHEGQRGVPAQPKLRPSTMSRITSSATWPNCAASVGLRQFSGRDRAPRACSTTPSWSACPRIQSIYPQVVREERSRPGAQHAIPPGRGRPRRRSGSTRRSELPQLGRVCAEKPDRIPGMAQVDVPHPFDAAEHLPTVPRSDSRPDHLGRSPQDRSAGRASRHARLSSARRSPRSAWTRLSATWALHRPHQPAGMIGDPPAEQQYIMTDSDSGLARRPPVIEGASGPPR
jgi:hypothetical protein